MKQATQFSVLCDFYVYLNYCCNFRLSFRYYIEQNTIKYSSPVRFGASAKMPKFFEFTNNHSDVFVVGNSQLDGFTGLDKDKKCGMNISMCRGATIEDCLAECNTRYRNMRNKVKHFYLQTKLG